MLASLASGGELAAADLRISPVRVTLSADQPTGVITIINRGSDDTLLQMTVLDWKQSGSEDKLTPTREVLGNPGVFLLKGNQQQVARFALRVGQDATERSYRISVQEVPRQHIPNSVTTLLRMLVPIFVAPPNPTATLDWSVTRDADGIALTARNNGNVHVQIKSIALSGWKNAPQARQLSIYVLPGNSRTIRIPVPKAEVMAGKITVGAETDQGRFSASIGVGVGIAKGAPGSS